MVKGRQERERGANNKRKRNRGATHNHIYASGKNKFAKENLDLKYEVEPNVSYLGNKGAIDELLHIFLENALKYTKDKGSVFALLKKEKSRIVFSIKNDVKDASKIDPDQLFDRFYRSPDTGKGGSGIGLSIAKEIIRMHKGDVKVNLENNRLEFIITL